MAFPSLKTPVFNAGRSEPRQPAVSIVVPVHDEEDNVIPLVEEIVRTFGDAGARHEIIVVDDGSRDRTAGRLREARKCHAGLRTVSLGGHRGKTAAMAAGIAEARAPLVGFLDGDLQNDPRDLLAMVATMHAEPGLTLLQGCRSDRCDSPARRLASATGRVARSLVLGDSCRDAGCGIRLLRTDVARQLPLEREGMHRFLSVLVVMLGGEARDFPVAHRPRLSGRSKYRVGILRRGCGGLLDLFAVRRMLRGHPIRPTARTPATPTSTGAS